MSDNTHMRPAHEGNAVCMREFIFHGRAFKREGLKLIGNHRWWSQTGSNRRPPACKAGALPTELWPRNAAPQQRREMVGLGRFELPTSRLSSARSNQLSYRPNFKPEHTRSTHAQSPLRAKGCSNDLGMAWARPRRKRNEDGEVLQIGMPVLKLTCPDVSKRSDSGTRMRASEGSSLERR
jgi:hypothetical protein